MKNEYAKAEIVETIKLLDKRAVKLSDPAIDIIMDRGYSRLTAMYGKAFSSEEIIDLAPLYASTENSITIDIEEDVIDIYDLYVTSESGTPYSCNQGVCEHRDPDVIYRDNRYSGRFHLDLEDTNYTNAIAKFYYTPVSTDDSIIVDGITMIALNESFAVALYDYVKDHKAKAESIAEMVRIGASIPTPPEDEPSKPRKTFAF